MSYQENGKNYKQLITHREFNVEANSKEVSNEFTSLDVDLSYF